MEIALALIAAALIGFALGRRGRRRREPVEELEDDPLYWDEGADDEID